MAGFTYTFDTSTPPGSALANTLDTVIQNDKLSIDERLKLEHYSLEDGASDKDSVTAQGRHIPGNVSAVFVGTTAQINALTGMKKGALAWDTDLEKLKIFDGTNWTNISVGGIPREAQSLPFRAYRNSAQSIPDNTTREIYLTSESYDPQSKFNVSNYRYTPGVEGYYMLQGCVSLTGIGSGGSSYATILKNGAVYSHGTEYQNASTATQRAVVSDLVYLGASDWVQLAVHQDTGASKDTIAGETKTFFSGYLAVRV